MHITRSICRLLHVPTDPPRASPAEVAAGRLAHVVVLLVELETDDGLNGLGMACALQGSGRALHATAVDDIAPLLIDENPLDHERLGAKVYWRLQGIGRRGLVAQAYSAFDVALWDLKGKAAGLPLYRLLGGARDSTPAYGSDTGFLWMSAEEIVDASRPYLEQGLMGIKVKVGQNPEEDADKLTWIREAFGDDVWLAVDANQRYDFGTALAMGRFYEDDMGCDWFEEPILCEDVAGHARLAEKLEIPLAGGESLFGRDEFRAYIDQNALAMLQPDVTRIGGLTNWLKVAAMAEEHHRPVSPHLLPEIGVHLGCGLPGVTCVEYMPWLFPLYTNPPQIKGGRLTPSMSAGLGLELNPDAIQRYTKMTNDQ